MTGFDTGMGAITFPVFAAGSSRLHPQLFLIYIQIFKIRTDKILAFVAPVFHLETFGSAPFGNGQGFTPNIKKLFVAAYCGWIEFLFHGIFICARGVGIAPGGDR